MKTFAVTLFVVTSLFSYGQGGDLNPVQWNFSTMEGSDGNYHLQFEAEIESGWAIYSQYLEDGGPIPTTFTFEDINGAELVGKVIEPDDVVSAYDDIFEMNVLKLSGTPSFVQEVKLTDNSTIVSGYLTFMACDKSKCLPPTDVEFSFSLEK